MQLFRPLTKGPTQATCIDLVLSQSAIRHIHTSRRGSGPKVAGSALVRQRWEKVSRCWAESVWPAWRLLRQLEDRRRVKICGIFWSFIIYFDKKIKQQQELAYCIVPFNLVHINEQKYYNDALKQRCSETKTRACQEIESLTNQTSNVESSLSAT